MQNEIHKQMANRDVGIEEDLCRKSLKWSDTWPFEQVVSGDMFILLSLRIVKLCGKVLPYINNIL
jgi:hypothetical protein